MTENESIKQHNRFMHPITLLSWEAVQQFTVCHDQRIRLKNVLHNAIPPTILALSHLIAAVIFRHKINEVRLFRLFQGKVDGIIFDNNELGGSNKMVHKARIFATFEHIC